MTAKFKVGDKVRCIRGDNCLIVHGKTYEVLDVEPTLGVLILNDETGVACWWYASRFELAEAAPEPTIFNFTVGQEVFLIANTSNCTKRLKSAVVLDAVPKHGMTRVSVGDIDCYVEEDRLFVKE